MKKWSAKMITEAGIMIALAILLNKLPHYELPMGGSITAGSMIPIIFFSIRWGVGPGILAGVTFGILKLVLGGKIYTPLQGILEYPIAFGLLGLSGVFSNSIMNEKKTNYYKVVISVFLAMIGRFICHFIAGVTVFAQYTPEGMHPWIYSLTYQASYLVPEFIISAIILSLLWKPLRRIAK